MKILKFGISFIVTCLLVLPIMAQSVTPDYIIEAAEELARSQIPDLGRINNWRHEIHTPTDDSSMGCPLLEGDILEEEIIPYELDITFGDLDYKIYVSADAEFVQLCDAKFPQIDFRIQDDGDEDGDTILNGEDECIYTAGILNLTGFNGCPVPSTGDTDGDGIIDTSDNCPLQPGAIDSSGCPLFPDLDEDTVPDIVDTCPQNPGPLIVEGTPPGCPINGSGASPNIRGGEDICFVSVDATTSSPIYESLFNLAVVGNLNPDTQLPIIGRTLDTSWYETPQGWILASNVNLEGGCYNIPVTDGTTGEQPSAICFLKPVSTLSNVRNEPSTSNTQIVREIFPNREYGVLGHNGDATWYRIMEGWVASSVSRLSGLCNDLETYDPNAQQLSAPQPTLVVTPTPGLEIDKSDG